VVEKHRTGRLRSIGLVWGEELKLGPRKFPWSALLLAFLILTVLYFLGR
jgi:hypothetical protein